MKCLIPGCTREAHVRGVCETHYQKLWLAGAHHNLPRNKPGRPKKVKPS